MEPDRLCWVFKLTFISLDVNKFILKFSQESSPLFNKKEQEEASPSFNKKEQ